MFFGFSGYGTTALTCHVYIQRTKNVRAAKFRSLINNPLNLFSFFARLILPGCQFELIAQLKYTFLIYDMKSVMSKYHKMDPNKYLNIFECHVIYQSISKYIWTHIFIKQISKYIRTQEIAGIQIQIIFYGHFI